MAHEQGGPSPQERLAMSRRALVNQLQGDMAGDEPQARRPGRRPRASLLEGIDWAPVARKAARHWWQHHPAHAVGQLALPLLERYARERPLKLVAAAAAMGALVVLIRPWRRLPASALAAALFKTSDAAALVNTLMQRRRTSRRKEPQ